MRQSVAANRTSHGAGLSSQANSAAAAAKYLEKKKEFDAVSALERASAVLVERIEGLGEDCDIMAEAGQGHYHYSSTRPSHADSIILHLVHGQVLEQWPKMFQILQLFCGLVHFLYLNPS